MATPTANLTFTDSDVLSVTFEYDGTDWSIPEDEAETAISWGNWSGGDLRQDRFGTSTQYSYAANYGGESIWEWGFYLYSMYSLGNEGKLLASSSSIVKTGTETLSIKKHIDVGIVKGLLFRTRKGYLIKHTYKQTRTRTSTSQSEWTVGVATKINSQATSDVKYKDMGQSENSFTVYFHPMDFEWKQLPKEGIKITDCITADKWNELAQEAVRKHDWKYCQQGQGGTPGGQIDWWAYRTQSGKPITASLYNSLAKYLDIEDVLDEVFTAQNINVVPNITTVTANHFIYLAKALNAQIAPWKKGK